MCNLSPIQIHLMLIFIPFASRSRLTNAYSNTSHVNLYHFGESKRNLETAIQIHLMLIFIYVCPHTAVSEKLIQIHLMLIFIRFIRMLY